MTSERTLQVNQLIKKELGQIVLKEVDLPEGALVTLTRVETSSNLIQAKVYVSVMPARIATRQSVAGGPEDKSSRILELLNGQIYFIQQKLNKRLKMRPMPKIMFIEDKAIREAGRVEELLEEIRKDDR